MNAPTFFVGYGSLEALLNSHQPDKPIYLELVVSSLGGNPVECREHCVLVSDIQNGVCRYWRRRLAMSEFLAGSPFDEKRYAANCARADSARPILERVIREVHRLRLESAAVAMPRDLRLMDGETDCLKWDKATDTYVSA